MALKLVVNIAKKVPGPAEFSSIQASCSMEGEIAVGQDPVAEAQRLYAQVEQAVDRQLGLNHPISPTQPPRPPIQRTTSPVSPAQLRYLKQLIDRQPQALNQILADHRISALEQLSSRDASVVIERLKGVPT